jgi:uncharacterized OB-fold protein
VPSVIPPSPTLDDQFFWESIAEGRLVFQRCAACGAVRHPPAPMCGDCHSVEWDTQESSGHGHVYTWIVSHHPTKPDAEPRVVVLVELDEGIRFVSNLLGVDASSLNEGSLDDGPVENGMEVQLSIEDVDGVVLPQFRPVEGGGA